MRSDNKQSITEPLRFTDETVVPKLLPSSSACTFPENSVSKIIF